MQRVQTMRRTPGRMYTYPPSNAYGFGYGQRHGDGYSALGSDSSTLGSGNASVFDGVGAFGLGGAVDPAVGSGVAFSILPPLPSKTPPTVPLTLPTTTMTIPLPLPATTTYSNYNYMAYSASTSTHLPSTSTLAYQSAYPGAPPPTPGSAPTPGPGQQGYSSATSTPAPGQGPGSSFGGHHAQHNSTPGPYGPPASTPTPQPGSGSYHHSYGGSNSSSTGPGTGPGVVPMPHHTHQPSSSNSSSYHYAGYAPYSSQSQQSQGQGYGASVPPHTPASVPPSATSSAGPSGSGAGVGVNSASANQRHTSMSQAQPSGQGPGSGESVYALEGYHHQHNHHQQPLVGHGRSASGIPTSSTPAPGGYQQNQSQGPAQPPTPGPGPGPPPTFPTYHMHQQHQQTLQTQSQGQGQSLVNVPSGSGSSLVSGVSHPIQNQGSASSNSSIGHAQGPTSASGVSLPPPSKVVGMPVVVKDEHEREAMMRECIPKIHQNVEVLYSFADRYSKLQVKTPNVQPTEEEIQEMTRRANMIIQLIEQLKQLSFPEESLPLSAAASSIITKKEAAGLSIGLGFAPAPGLSASASASAGERAPKRPWEDMADDMQGSDYGYASDKQIAGGQTMAEKDMAIIRSKRATNGAGPIPGAPKGKYRKRSSTSKQRASPPGKCHSCNIKETPEWRRGPDGARTLCNACGLHYAKLIRKRDKVIQSSGQAPPKVDLETLRAATRAADKDNPVRHRTQLSQASTSQFQQDREDSASASGSAGVHRQLSQSSIPPQQSPPTMVAHYFSDTEMAVAPPTHSHSHAQQSPTTMPPPSGPSWTTLPPAQRAYAPPEGSSFARASHARSSIN